MAPESEQTFLKDTKKNYVFGTGLLRLKTNWIKWQICTYFFFFFFIRLLSIWYEFLYWINCALYKQTLLSVPFFLHYDKSIYWEWMKDYSTWSLTEICFIPPVVNQRYHIDVPKYTKQLTINCNRSGLFTHLILHTKSNANITLTAHHSQLLGKRLKIIIISIVSLSFSNNNE